MIELDDNDLDQIDQLIRNGQSLEARQKIEAIDFQRISRLKLSRLCSLARRSGVWRISLQALRPIVRPKVRGHITASPDELIEYALALRRAGAPQEANLILKEVLKKELIPKALLASAFGHIERWNYDEALTFLNKYIQCPGVGEYEVLTAQVNRLSCLYYSNEAEFLVLYQSLERELSKGHSNMLFANCLEAFSQYLISKNQWQQASDFLLRAKNLVDPKTRSSLFIEKWLAIVQALQSGSLPQIDALRRTAFRAEEWETLRGIDNHLTRIAPDNKWSNFVYFGTPYPAFRKSLEQVRTFGTEAWLSRSDSPSESFDPWFPRADVGSLGHRLVTYLLRDLYRPFHSGEIFGAFFPGQYFENESSDARVRKMVARTRAWLREENIPLTIRQISGQYCVRLGPSIRVLAHQQLLPTDRLEFLFERFRDRAGQNLVSDEWAHLLGLSIDTTRGLLRQACADGIIEKWGSGHFVSYSIPSRKPVT